MHEAIAGLYAVQGELPALKKSADNPFFKSKYIPLEAIHEAVDPLLQKHGLIWTALPCVIDGGAPGLRYALSDIATGDSLSGIMPLMLDKNNPQGQGSAITYARRYALSAVLGIVADVDDDGNKASMPPKPPKDFGISEKSQSFTEQVRATGKKAAEIRTWAASEGFLLDDVGTDAKGLTKFLDGLPKEKKDALLAWAM